MAVVISACRINQKEKPAARLRAVTSLNPLIDGSKLTVQSD